MNILKILGTVLLISFLPAFALAQEPIRINAGGPEYIDTHGNTWQADNYYNTGYKSSTSNQIQGTEDDTLYQTDRWDQTTTPELSYNIPVENGEYTIILHFAEIWSGAFNNNIRVFDIYIQNQLKTENLDIFKEVGANTKLTKTYNITTNNNNINITLQRKLQNPKISAIEIYQTNTPNNQTPITLTCNANPTTGNIPLNTQFTTTINGGSGIYTNYEWNFNDGTTTNTNNSNTTHIYTNQGTYNPTIKVTDSQGQTKTANCPKITTTNNTPINNTSNIISDDFNSCSLNNIWTFINPIGDGTYNINGTNILISVPYGTDHDVWTTGNNAPRIMQNINNTNFEIETKFDSIPSEKFQMQGILIEQDNDDFLRIEYYHDGENHKLLIVKFVNNTYTIINNTPLNGTYLRVNRTGNNWNIYTYEDGETWTKVSEFAHSMITNKVGVYAGNVRSSSIPGSIANAPAYTASIDYFFNNNERIDPEDENITLRTLTTMIMGQGSIIKNPDKESYACNEELTVTAIPDSGYRFSEWQGDISGNTTTKNIVMDSDKDITAIFVQKPLMKLRINAGGPEYVDNYNNTWIADQYFNTGYPSSKSNNITNTSNQKIYQTNRWDSINLPEMEYNIPVEKGIYQVNLHFAEIWSGAFSNGVRVFDVNIENETVLQNFDIYAQAGANTAIIKSFNTTVEDGELNIFFKHIIGKNNPMISAIEIIQLEKFRTGPVIYREYSRVMTGNFEWRVNDPNATYVGDPDNTPAYYLPNRVLNISIDDLDGAIRAEAIIDLWGGHPGTTNKSMRFNNNTWINIKELSNTPDLGQCYMSERTVVVDIPLEHLTQGMNYFEGTSGGQSNCFNFGWGQWGWYGIVVRIYYNESKPHTYGRITSHSDGGVLTENPTLQVETLGSVQRIDFIGYYDGYDTAGNGIYQKYHYDYQMKSFGGIIDMNNHIGTINSSQNNITWNTTFIPDQANNTIKLKARILDNNGIWYETEEVKDLSLIRNANVSVKLYKPVSVPQAFWVRIGQTKFSKINIPEEHNLSDAIDSRLLIRTWNGIDGGSLPTETQYTKFNNWTTPKYGKDHFYSYDQVKMPPIFLKHNTSNIIFYSQSTGHGIEIMWPGPALIVRYDKGAPKPNYNSLPNISIWYGDNQSFGHIGNAQKWINIQGNAYDENDIISLYYSLNNGPNKTLSLGSDSRRLASKGDFNIDINRSMLVSGINNITITAINSLGNRTVKNMKIAYTDNNTWTQPYTINWNETENVQDVAEVVDGLWIIENDTIRTEIPGYDRLIAIGDINWTDYEITAPITVHNIDLKGFDTWVSGKGTGIGFLMRWQGHTDNPISNWQPKTGWRPFGAIGWYWWTSPTSARLQIHRENILPNGTIVITDTQTSSTIPPEYNITYFYKMQVITEENNASTYSMKVWPANETEPSSWTLTTTETTPGIDKGSVILLAHHVNASFGKVEIKPIILEETPLLSQKSSGGYELMITGMDKESDIETQHIEETSTTEVSQYVVQSSDYIFHSRPAIK